MKSTKEEWRAILNYPDYQVSNYGKVKSLGRVVTKSNGVILPIIERILTGSLRKGYKRVNLRNGTDKSKQFSVHTLVAMAFLDFIPCGMEKVIDHIDFDKTNNHVSNLRITTNRENCSKDKWRKNTTSKCVGVGWSKQRSKWRSRIYIDGKDIHLGFTNSEIEASKLYQSKLATL